MADGLLREVLRARLAPPPPPRPGQVTTLSREEYDSALMARAEWEAAYGDTARGLEARGPEVERPRSAADEWAAIVDAGKPTR